MSDRRPLISAELQYASTICMELPRSANAARPMPAAKTPASGNRRPAIAVPIDATTTARTSSVGQTANTPRSSNVNVTAESESTGSATCQPTLHINSIATPHASKTRSLSRNPRCAEGVAAKVSMSPKANR